MIIIAVFYPNPQHPFKAGYLVFVFAAMLVSFALRWKKCMVWQPYIVIGGMLSWIGLLGAGLHPALALVFVVPFLPDHAPHDDNGDEAAPNRPHKGSMVGLCLFSRVNSQLFSVAISVASMLPRMWVARVVSWGSVRTQDSGCSFDMQRRGPTVVQ